MERKIIFRGKNQYRKEWLYGNLVQYKDGSFNIDGVPVETDSVGQFTGMLDKNGKEIYEGDILGCPEDNYFLNEVVIFAEGCFMVKDDYTTTPMCAIDAQYRTVIGNIHDNPSLISDKR